MTAHFEQDGRAGLATGIERVEHGGAYLSGINRIGIQVPDDTDDLVPRLGGNGGVDAGRTFWPVTEREPVLKAAQVSNARADRIAIAEHAPDERLIDDDRMRGVGAVRRRQPP